MKCDRQIPTRRRASRIAMFAVFIAALVLPGMAIATPAAAQEWAAPTTVYVPETGQSVDGYFLDTWRAWGGPATFGNPITPEFIEDGRTVQYFEFARLEYWPDDPNGEVVKLGDIGLEMKSQTVCRPAAGQAASSEELTDIAREQMAWLPVEADDLEFADNASRRYIPEAKHVVKFGFKTIWEETGETTYLGLPLTEEYIVDGTTYQVFERGKLAWEPGKIVWFEPVGSHLVTRYGLDTQPRSQGNLPVYDEALFIPPAPPEPEPEAPPQVVVPTGEKWIEINLSWQYMTVWQGNTVIAESYVSTGRPGFDTPTGTYYVMYHIASQTMEGVLGGEYYNVPDVPWVMYFTGGGHAIHGAYWHGNFGAVMSHGCVNLPVGFSAFLYDWAPDGTRIEIHY